MSAHKLSQMQSNDEALEEHLSTTSGRAEMACEILRDLLAAAHDPHTCGCPDANPTCWSMPDLDVQSAKSLLARLDKFTQ